MELQQARERAAGEEGAEGIVGNSASSHVAPPRSELVELGLVEEPVAGRPVECFRVDMQFEADSHWSERTMDE